MKVDCHCHILPRLDDGAQTLEDSVFLAGKLVEWGYQRAICTAHSSFLYRNTPSTVKAACELLRAELERRWIPMLHKKGIAIVRCLFSWSMGACGALYPLKGLRPLKLLDLHHRSGRTLPTVVRTFSVNRFPYLTGVIVLHRFDILIRVA